MSDKITSLISQAFDKLDPEGTGAASLDCLSNNYQADKHPHVLSRRKAPEEVYSIFLNGMTRKAENGKVSRAAFVDYYADINFCVPTER